MKESILLFLIKTVVPYLLDALVNSSKAPSVTEGMVKDYEVKVGVPEKTRNIRHARRLKRLHRR